MKNRKLRFVGGFLALSATGCGSDGAASTGNLPWQPGSTEIVKPDGTTQVVDNPSGNDCVPGFAQEFCSQPQKQCGDGSHSDLIAGSNGQVLDLICYPASNTLSVTQLQAQDGGVRQNQNNEVIVVGGTPDAGITGNVGIDANNVVIYGDAEHSTLQGDLAIDGNNVIVRGVHITGSVTVTKNDAVFVRCVIDGDLTITANNTTVAGCQVFGSIHIQGNNTKLLNDAVVGALDDAGKNTECQGDQAAVDQNHDGVLSSDELGAALDCGHGKGK